MKTFKKKNLKTASGQSSKDIPPFVSPNKKIKKQLEELIERLVVAIKKSKEYTKDDIKLPKGADPDKIMKTEKILGTAFPEDLSAFYAMHDGPTIGKYYFQFLSLKEISGKGEGEIAENLEEFVEENTNNNPEDGMDTWIPVANLNGSQDCWLFYDPKGTNEKKKKGYVLYIDFSTSVHYPDLISVITGMTEELIK